MKPFETGYPAQPGRTIVWFSCGIASAVAAKLMPEAEVVYCDTSADEHPDNLRFLHDVETWIGREIKIIRSDKYTTIDEVFEQTRWMAGIEGARCTTELKKLPRIAYSEDDDIHVFGFTVEEVDRATNLKRNNPGLYLSWPLIDNWMTKKRCLQMVAAAGIRIPTMYELGFANNNCLGCVKATSPKYWNMIRRHFPAAFEQRAKRSRELGARLTRVRGERIFLDELPADETEDFYEDISCGPLCGLELARQRG